jgi:hypothetical protein
METMYFLATNNFVASGNIPYATEQCCQFLSFFSQYFPALFLVLSATKGTVDPNSHGGWTKRTISNENKFLSKIFLKFKKAGKIP